MHNGIVISILKPKLSKIEAISPSAATRFILLLQLIAPEWHD